MAWWRKKSDGFDWHAYVRTTIKLRREERRERLENIRGAMAERAGQARDAVAAGSAAAGASALTGVRKLIALVLSALITSYVAVETVV